MAIRVALNHQTLYRYDRLVTLSPQTIRLRPAPHCRTPIVSYSLTIQPSEHFINWQQDPQSNYLARVVFPQQTRELSVEVDLVADMTVIDPFDFFLEPSAAEYPFCYEPGLAKELASYLETEPAGPRLQAFVNSVSRAKTRTVDFLVALNQRVQQEIQYIIRLEPGIQSCEETLTLRRGSCRDSAWLLLQILRHLGLAARFVSGYLIQLVADVTPLDGPVGPVQDLPICMPGPRCTCLGPDGLDWTPRQGCWPAKGTSHWRARRTPPARPRSRARWTGPRWSFRLPCR